MNRADGPSRLRPPDPPDLEFPSWWDAALEGNFKEMDHWLEEASRFSAERKIPFDQLMGVNVEMMEPSRSRSKPLKLKRQLKVSKADGGKEGHVSLPVPSPVPVQGSKGLRKELLLSFKREQFFPQEGELDLSVPGALDLFSGCFGVAKEMVKAGCPWVLSFELKRFCDEDLLNEELQQKLFKLLGLEAFESVGMAPVCASFSRAVTPPVLCSEA